MSARLRTQIELSIPELESAARVEVGLALITGAPSATLRAVMEGTRFGLIANVNDEELQGLCAALSNSGLRFRRSSLGPTAGQYSLRLAAGHGLWARLGAVLCVALGCAGFGVPLVSWAAVPVAALLIWGAIERVPDSLEVTPAFVEEKLAAVDRTVWSELVVTRRGIRSAEGVAAAERCCFSLCVVIDQIRSNGAHLVRADYANLDHDAHALLRRSVRLAAAHDRVALACAQPNMPESRSARLRTARREMLSALAIIEHKLEALRLSLIELDGLEARNEDLASVMSRVTEIQVAVETGLELSSLASEEPRARIGAR